MALPINESASFNIVVPFNQTFTPGSLITFNNFFSNRLTPTEITFPGGIGSSTIHLNQGSYIINYSASVFNTGQSVALEIIQDGNLIISSFSAGPAGSNGTAHTSGNTLIIAVPAGGSNIQLRVDPNSGPVTPFSNVTMIIENVGIGPLT